jgi:hypothetical protein
MSEIGLLEHCIRIATQEPAKDGGAMPPSIRAATYVLRMVLLDLAALTIVGGIVLFGFAGWQKKPIHASPR